MTASKAVALQQDATDDGPDIWYRLCEPFAADEIELLPKPFSKDSPKGQCDRPDREGLTCGGYHGLPAVHLSYVGHAGITTRLNDVCGPDGWGWEPFALDQYGLPLIVNGGLWIKLWIETEGGRSQVTGSLVGKRVEKIGYGDAPGKNNATKELIGDAIRNAAMRFGIGTYLWSKSARAKGHLERGDADSATAAPEPERPAERTQQRPAQRGAGRPAQDRADHVQAFYQAFAKLDELDQAVVRSEWGAADLPAQGPDALNPEQSETALMLIIKVQTDRANREQAAAGEPPPF